MKVTGGLRFTIAIVVAVAALVPASATAHTVRWSTSSTIDAYYEHSYHSGPPDLITDGWANGHISSPKPACIANRTVEVYRNGVYVAQATSQEWYWNPGSWGTTTYQPGDGMISATVKRKNIGPAGHRHLCERYVAGPVDATYTVRG